MDKQNKPAPKTAPKPSRQTRLGAALRANLRRRKQAVRERKD